MSIAAQADSPGARCVRRLLCVAVLAALSLSLLVGIAAPASAAVRPTLAPADSSSTFDDEFDGSSIDSTLWNTDVATSGRRFCNDSPDSDTGVWIDISVDPSCHGVLVSPPYASITEGGGVASFAAPPGHAFGYLVAGPPSRHPFPSAGDFVLELRMRYDVTSQDGDGVMVLDTDNADPVGTNSPLAVRVLQVWNGFGGSGVSVLGNYVPVADPSVFHDYRLEYTGGVYSLFVDGALAHSPIASAIRPSTIWLGHADAVWWGSSPWTSFSVDSIRVTPSGNAVAPAAPSLIATVPGSPANDNGPEVRGTAEAGSQVRLYAGADCSGAAVVAGSADEFASPGLTASVGDDSSTDFRATATDAAGNVSVCSAALTYVEDSTAPSAPVITGTDPASPANENTPEIKGNGEAGSTVRVYRSGDCSGAVGAEGSATNFESPGLTVSVGDDQTQPLTAAATDQALNTSGCSTVFSYTEVSTPPAAGLVASPNPVLTGDTVTFDASGSLGLTISRYEWDLDGDGSFETDTGSQPTASRSYSAVGEISPGVRVTNQLGQSSEARVPLSIRLRPPPGNLGVSINDGARFTNDPHVTMVALWPLLAHTIAISNDGGFVDPGLFPVAARTPWTLDSSGSERLPRIVYVRFAGGSGVGPTQTFSDDIILDETAPAIYSATATGPTHHSAAAGTPKHKPKRQTYRLRITARDKTSGVESMQVTKNKRRPGELRHFTKRLNYESTNPRIYVRVQDAAGNFSHWKRVTRTVGDRRP